MIAHLLIFISFIELITSVLFLSNHIPQNNFIGIRTKETFQNKKLWYKINQRFAIGFYLTGIIHMMYYLLIPNITKEKIVDDYGNTISHCNNRFIFYLIKI